MDVRMNRIIEIDYTKAIGIILMVLGHCYSNTNLLIRWLYSFHMPLFFIAPGIIYGQKKSKLKFSWKNRLISIILPYFIFGAVYTIFLFSLSKFQDVNMMVIRFKMLFTLQGVSALWFLPCIFLAELIFKFLLNQKYGLIYIISVMLIGLFSPNTNNYLLVILRAFVGTGFMAIGYYCSKYYIQKINPILVIFTFFIQIFLSLQNQTVSLAALEFGNVFLYIINSVLGTYIVIQFCIVLKDSKLRLSFLNTIGKNTIIVLGTSSILIEIIRLFDYKIFNNILNRLNIFEGIILCIIVMIVEYIIIYIYKRYLKVNLIHGVKKNVNSFI